MLKVVALFSFVVVISARSIVETEELRWPDKYYFEITQINVKSGLVLDTKIWRTEDQSRIEYNGGTMKTYVISSKDGPVNYEMHLEADSNEESSLVCNKLDEENVEFLDGPQTVLPDPDEFIPIGNEMMKDENCTKFICNYLNGTIRKKQTLWALYDEKTHAWIPVRYENEEFNTWLGYVDRHDIWDFFNFQSDFKDKKIFNVKKSCSTEKTISHKKHEEAVTKHLLFVNPNNKKHVDHVFETFKTNFNKQYLHEKEHMTRKRILENNMRRIIETNRKNLGYQLSLNHLADRTPEELKRFTGLRKRRSGQVGTHPFPYNATRLDQLSDQLPTEYDLRTEGLVSSVKNQEDCGSCWSFGSTAAAEGALARYTQGPLIALANQALIDCAWPDDNKMRDRVKRLTERTRPFIDHQDDEYGTWGCDGGSDAGSYEFMIEHGMPTEAEYGTYLDKDGFCNIKNMSTTYKIRGFVDVTPNSVGALKVALVNHGPLTVSVHVSDNFVLYRSGVFYDLECDSSELNHEVALVGYGSYFGETYWIIKNSWGPNWGVGGYMHISARNNNCGIMSEPTYVLF